MKVWRLVFSRHAQAVLDAIHDLIADHASVASAVDYTARLRASCLRLSTYPKRGEVRDDIRSGLRLIGFEKSVTIAFVVDEERDEVRILRLLYRGQDFKG